MSSRYLTLKDFIPVLERVRAQYGGKVLLGYNVENRSQHQHWALHRRDAENLKPVASGDDFFLPLSTFRLKPDAEGLSKLGQKARAEASLRSVDLSTESVWERFEENFDWDPAPFASGDTGLTDTAVAYWMKSMIEVHLEDMMRLYLDLLQVADIEGKYGL